MNSSIKEISDIFSIVDVYGERCQYLQQNVCIYQNLNRPPEQMTKSANKEMSELFEIRKLQAMGTRGVGCIHTHNGPHSFASVIPQTYVQQLGLKKGDFLKFYLVENRLWMEKLEDENPQRGIA